MTNQTETAAEPRSIQRHLAHMSWMLDEWAWQSLLVAGVLAAIVDAVLALGGSIG